MVPQTVSFVANFRFDHIERMGTGQPEQVTREFDSFEALMETFRVERRRRKNADRCTSATYRMVLTDHGREVCRNDEYRAKSHADAINGTWFKM